MTIHDHGENDPIPFELGSWAAVAEATRRAIEEKTGRVLTHIEDIA